jgi:GNAT superfamily N-acetyltransferase
VDCGITAVEINYVASGVSALQGESTSMDLQCHNDCLEMWIRQLEVATPFRLQGLGTDLVSVAESIAAGLGMRKVHVLPLSHARQFWRKLGYVPEEKTARVLVKRLSRC